MQSVLSPQLLRIATTLLLASAHAQPPSSGYLAQRTSELHAECAAAIGGTLALSDLEKQADEVLRAAAAPLSADPTILSRSFFDSAEDMRASRLFRANTREHKRNPNEHKGNTSPSVQ